MLGEMIGEDKGKITGFRVVASRKGDNHVEVSMKAQGKILGVEFNELGTYVSVMKPGGFSYGEGRGIYMLQDGETASWVGQGTGNPHLADSWVAVDSDRETDSRLQLRSRHFRHLEKTGNQVADEGV